MMNCTDPAAKSIRGTNSHNLMEKIVREKIYQNSYGKEQCFGLTAETLAMELDHIGGTFGGIPDSTRKGHCCRIHQERCPQVCAFYLRLTGIDTDVYRYLEPLYNDYRKLRQRSPKREFHR